MPRTARKISSTGYMHIIARGIGRQILFESSSDYRKYLLLLQKYCNETNVKICAFCLMENHVHLLTHSEKDALVLMMKALNTTYAGYFNNKYERTGHLFQNRYKSEPIEDERYLLTVFRYILLNPQKAGICNASDYTWSSYSLYEKNTDFMELDLIRELIGDPMQYKCYIESDNDDECLEWDYSKRDDAWAINEIKSLLHVNNFTDIQRYDSVSRNRALSILRKRGLSIRQIERLTGISRGIIKDINK